MRDPFTLRVLTLNVWSDSRGPERQELLRSGIRDLDADLVCLQEVVRSPEHDALEALVGDSDLHWFHEADWFDGPHWGTAIGTRWKPREVDAYRLKSATHGPVAISAIVPLPIGVDLLFIGAKPTYSFNGEAERCEQALFLTEIEQRLRQAAPTIVAGDFDASPDHDSMRFWTGKSAIEGRSVQFRDAWTHAGDGGPGYTWGTDNRWVEQTILDGNGIVPDYWVQSPHRRRIDYVLAGCTEDHIEVPSVITSCRVVLTGDPAPSDHYGVLAEIQLLPARN